MSFKAYLNSKFQHTHENQIFDELIKRLYAKYKDSAEHVVLLGNFFYNNRDVDAMIVKPDGIIIIDFKDYGGSIQFSENGVWTADSKPIQGGSFVNPFAQLRATRNPIANFFKINKDEIFGATGKGVTYYDLYCLVMFHKKATLVNTMPAETRKWFFISDIEDISQASYQITNANLNITEGETNKVIDLLELVEYFPENLVPNEVKVTTPKFNSANVNLTESQGEGMKHIEKFLSSDSENLFILKGAAGTGKTYLINEIIDVINRNENSDYWVLAPTGKAGVNIRAKFDHLGVKTVHSLIYKRVPQEDTKANPNTLPENHIYEIVFGLRPNEDSENAVYIIDEASLMTDSELRSEFLRFGSDRLLTDFFQYCNLKGSKRKVIFIGDDKQIIRGKNDQTALTDEYISQHYGLKVFSFELKEIVRQAKDNPIVQEAWKLRDSITQERYNNFNIVPDGNSIIKLGKDNLGTNYIKCLQEDRPEDTIIIKYSNSQVKQVNDWVRKSLMKRDDSIQVGDLIMFYRNYHFADDIAIQNGEVGTIVKIEDPELQKQFFGGGKQVDLVFRKIVVDLPTRKGKEVTILENFLTSDETSISKDEVQALMISFSQNYFAKNGAYPNPTTCGSAEKYYKELISDKYLNSALIKYAYAITCHKAQGSEWKNVFVDFEWKNQENNYKDQYFRWAYTSITRSKKNFQFINAPCLKPASRITWSDAGIAYDESFKIDEFYYDSFLIANEQTENEVKKLNIPGDKPFLKSLYTYLAASLKPKDYRINTFKVSGYQLKVGLSLKQLNTELQYYFNAKGGFKLPTISDSSTQGQALGKEVIEIIQNGGANDFIKALKYDFLHSFYNELKQALGNKGITIINILQEANCFKATIKKESKVALVSFYFELEGFISTVYPTKTNSKELLEEIKEVVNHLKECE